MRFRIYPLENTLLILKFSFRQMSKFSTLGGERSRLWMLGQGKRAEEARMISLTNNLCKKISASTTAADYALAA